MVIKFLDTFLQDIEQTVGWKGMRVWLLVRSLIHLKSLLTISSLYSY
jgi:hypothetical protein